VFNRKLANLAETQRLSTGEKWKRFSLADLSKMADPFAYQALEFDLAGHYQEGDFQDNGGIFESTGSGQSGIWEFSNVHAGTYLLSISSEKYAAQGQKILVSYKTGAQEQYNEPASVLFVQGVALYGIVELAGENLCNLKLKIISDSENKLDLKGVRLEPVYSVDGRINVNTSTPEVLRAIFNDDSLAQAVLASRPIGIINNAKLGVGQLFLLNQAYLSFHDYLTVKSDVYEIDCRGEYYKQGKTMAYQIIHTVVERGE
ncbi:MAG: type II secretion system protein GspK, partial [Deltaproteobacteria bacterium]